MQGDGEAGTEANQRHVSVGEGWLSRARMGARSTVALSGYFQVGVGAGVARG